MRKSSANYNSNATYTLEWSPDGTTYNAITFTEAAAGGWGLATGAGLSLPAGAANQPVLYLRWIFVRTGTSSNFKIDDVSVTGNNASAGIPPFISMNVAATSNYLDGGAAASPASPYTISGVISDPTDPAATLGLDFTISDSQLPAVSLTVTTASSSPATVPNANVSLTGSGASRNVKITPVGVGYSNITLTVDNRIATASYVLSYASSAAAAAPSATTWHTGGL